MQTATTETALTERGVRFALGRREDSYGVFELPLVGGPPVAQYPLTAEGWFAARRRFTELEALGVAPGTRTTDSTATHAEADPNSGAVTARIRLSMALLVVGVALGVVGLFPSYLGGTSLSAQNFQLVSHVFYLSAWAATAVVLAADVALRRGAAAFGAAVSAATFGFLASDAAQAISGPSSSVGAGLVLSLVGWALCVLGSGIAFVTLRRSGEAGGPRWHDRVALSAGGLAGVAIAVTFAPSWDRYVLSFTSTNQVQIFTAGNAFANPGLVIAANVVVMVVTVALLMIASGWLPRTVGVALVAGTLLPHVAQMFSALSETMMKPSSTQFGISPVAAATEGLTISTSLTTWFYLYCAAIALAAAVGLRQLLRPRSDEGAVASPS